MADRGRAAAWLLLVVALVAVGLALFAFELPRPPADEMAPGLRQGDLLLACRVCGEPQRGDIVVFSLPDAPPGQLHLRRVVAVPGDRIEVRRGLVLINGLPLENTPGEYVTLTTQDATGLLPHRFRLARERSGTHAYDTLVDDGMTPTGESAPVQLESAYFLLADRRTLERDSRDYGPVRRSQIRAIITRVLWAADGDSTRQRALR